MENKGILLVNLDNKIYAINNTCTYCRLQALSMEILNAGDCAMPVPWLAFQHKNRGYGKRPGGKTSEPAYKVTVKNGEITLAF